MKLRTEIIDDPEKTITRYGLETGCSGCRIPTHSMQCENCIVETGYSTRYRNFDPIVEYYKKPVDVERYEEDI